LITDADLAARLQRVVADVFSLSPEEVSPQSSPEAIQLWDSVGHLNLVLALEQEFKVYFSPEQMQEMTSVASIMRILQTAAIEDVPGTRRD
jgi:acyl carrier protein